MTADIIHLNQAAAQSRLASATPRELLEELWLAWARVRDLPPSELAALQFVDKYGAPWPVDRHLERFRAEAEWKRRECVKAKLEGVREAKRV